MTPKTKTSTLDLMALSQITIKKAMGSQSQSLLGLWGPKNSSQTPRTKFARWGRLLLKYGLPSPAAPKKPQKPRHGLQGPKPRQGHDDQKHARVTDPFPRQTSQRLICRTRHRPTHNFLVPRTPKKVTRTPPRVSTKHWASSPHTTSTISPATPNRVKPKVK